MWFVTGMKRVPARSTHHPQQQPTARESPAKGGRELADTRGPVVDTLVLLDGNGSKEHRVVHPVGLAF